MLFVRLQRGRGTALGPALLISIFIASKVAGSRVVLCTDGCANMGVGDLRTGNQTSTASEFYARLGETASSNAFVPFLLFFSASLIVKTCSVFDRKRGTDDYSLRDVLTCCGRRFFLIID